MEFYFANYFIKQLFFCKFATFCQKDLKFIKKLRVKCLDFNMHLELVEFLNGFQISKISKLYHKL